MASRSCEIPRVSGGSIEGRGEGAHGGGFYAGIGRLVSPSGESCFAGVGTEAKGAGCKGHGQAAQRIDVKQNEDAGQFQSGIASFECFSALDNFLRRVRKEATYSSSGVAASYRARWRSPPAASSVMAAPNFTSTSSSLFKRSGGAKVLALLPTSAWAWALALALALGWAPSIASQVELAGTWRGMTVGSRVGP